jgi:thiamine biosynthesis protein ThiS
MQIIVNGKPREAREDLTISGLLEDLKLNPQTTIVELNRNAVERGSYSEIGLSPGDRIEFVRLVGGG